MSKVIMVSRYFPKHHPKAGSPTYFPEKILNSLVMAMLPIYTPETPIDFLSSLSKDFFLPKHHTIRGGKRWKTGDLASIRVWSGKPYRSPQITLAPDVSLTVRDIEIDDKGWFSVNGGPLMGQLRDISINDGLDPTDFRDWFANSLPFSGQILIWNPAQIKY